MTFCCTHALGRLDRHQSVRLQLTPLNDDGRAIVRYFNHERAAPLLSTDYVGACARSCEGRPSLRTRGRADGLDACSRKGGTPCPAPPSHRGVKLA